MGPTPTNAQVDRDICFIGFGRGGVGVGWGGPETFCQTLSFSVCAQTWAARVIVVLRLLDHPLHMLLKKKLKHSKIPAVKFSVRHKVTNHQGDALPHWKKPCFLDREGGNPSMANLAGQSYPKPEWGGEQKDTQSPNRPLPLWVAMYWLVGYSLTQGKRMEQSKTPIQTLVVKCEYRIPL